MVTLVDPIPCEDERAAVQRHDDVSVLCGEGDDGHCWYSVLNCCEPVAS